jgi:integrase|tara:strand:+ start:3702 stop:5240 length:1539 start_codon:yes stop_codon:yes gene_type:complete
MTINDNDKAVAAVAAPAVSSKKSYKRREAIWDTKFSFTDQNMARAKHILGKRYDRRYDERLKGLCVHLRPSGVKTFYAYKSVAMYNKKKNEWTPNVVYKKMFHWAKNTGFNCEAAREKVSKILETIIDSRSKADSEITVEYLVRKFIKTGLNGFTLKDDSRMYKEETVQRYIGNLERYVLYEGCTDQTVKKHTAPIDYMNTIYSKPLKSFIASELTDDAIKAHKFKLKDTPQVYNTVATLLSVVYNWAKMNKFYKGDNPFLFVKRYPKVKLKSKLPDDVRDKIKDYCEGKAFDYNAHFLTIIATVLYTGFRGNEIYGLRWTEPRTEEEKKKCSGWLINGWDRPDEKGYLFLWDPKNRKEFKAYLRTPLKNLLIRLRKKLYNDQKVSWCLKSEYIFPKSRWSANYPEEHTDSYAQTYHLRKLNEEFGLRTENSKGRLKNMFTIKIGRKTFGSEVAAEKGVEIASRALNHSDTQVTRDHYIVPEDSDLDFEFEGKKTNVENIERHRFDKFKKVK